VTLSATITGTAPITNQWAVNKGSGFVSIRQRHQFDAGPDERADFGFGNL
jgi:hypothetical protein